MKKIFLFSSDKKFVSDVYIKFKNFKFYDDVINLLTSTLLNKPNIIILDTKDLPFMNEEQTIKTLNQISPFARIILITRDYGIEDIKRLRKNNNIFFTLNEPEELFDFFKIFEIEKEGVEYELN